MSLIRFLPGIIALEIATAALVYAVTGLNVHEALWVPVAVLELVVTLLAAFWFGSIADHVKKDALVHAKAHHAQERENLVVTAEIGKRAALEESHRRIVKETAKAQSQANWRLGLGLSGLLMLGGAMLAIEFMTIGLLIVATAGGVLGGYWFRARQEPHLLRRHESKPPLLPKHVIKALETGSSEPGDGAK